MAYKLTYWKAKDNCPEFDTENGKSTLDNDYNYLYEKPNSGN